MLTLDELRADVETGAIDTVIAAFTDMQGRLMGKRLDAEFFLEELDAGHEVEGCNYLLALEMEMDPVPGYALASWERGYGDFGLQPDLGTLRRIPWHDATALVLCDVQWHDGSPVAPSPRQVLKAQVEKARGLGFEAMFGSELEFFLFRETYEEAHAKHYRDLTPSVPYILDYHILASGYDEPFMRAIRRGMKVAGMKVESSKGEAWPGQHEINFRYADALKTADDHVIYKTGVKELAHQCGMSVTFMAKPDHTWVGFVVPRPLLALARRRGRVRRRVRPLQAVPGGPDRSRIGARDLLRSDRQLVQALRCGQLGTDNPRLGARQPDVRLPGRRPRLVAPARDADSRRRRESLPRLRRAARLRTPRDRARPRARAGLRGQRVRVRCRALPAHAARRDREARERHRREGVAR